MRIALVAMRTDPSRGGAERYTVDLAGALAGANHDVTMLAPSFVGVPETVSRVPLPANGLTRVRRYERFLGAVDAHLLAARYDVVHAMLPVRQCDVYHPHAGIARAMTANDGWKTRLFNQRRARGADVEGSLLDGTNPPLVLCLSEYVKSAVRRSYELPDDRMPILFNSVDTAHYDPHRRPDARALARANLGIDPGRTVALFVGQDPERKGLRAAIRALGALRGAGARELPLLLCVGRIRTSRYRALAQEEGVADAVLFAGHIDDTYLPYAAADYLVLPTKHDPCSLVVLEALAMGVPVISTRFNGACEIMTPGEHGFVLDDPSDPGPLSRAMETLGDRSARSRMSAACLTLRPRLAYARHLERLLEIYASVDAIRRR